MWQIIYKTWSLLTSVYNYLSLNKQKVNKLAIANGMNSDNGLEKLAVDEMSEKHEGLENLEKPKNVVKLENLENLENNDVNNNKNKLSYDVEQVQPTKLDANNILPSPVKIEQIKNNHNKLNLPSVKKKKKQSRNVSNVSGDALLNASNESNESKKSTESTASNASSKKEEEFYEEVDFAWLEPNKKMHQTEILNSAAKQSSKKEVKAEKKPVVKKVPAKIDTSASNEKVTTITKPTVRLIDAEGQDFAEINTYFMTLFNIYQDAKVNKSFSIEHDVRSNAYYACVQLLEELKKYLKKIFDQKGCFIPSLNIRIITLRNTIVDRFDYFLMGDSNNDELFISANEYSFLNLTLKTYYIMQAYIESSYNKMIEADNSDIYNNDIIQYAYGHKNILELPMLANEIDYLRNIYKAIKNDLARSLKHVNSIDEFINSPQVITNTTVALVKVCGWIRALKDRAPELSRIVLGSQFITNIGFLLTALERLKQNGKDYVFLKQLVEMWRFDQVLGVSISLRNVFSHYQGDIGQNCKSATTKLDPTILFIVTKRLVELQPALKNMLELTNPAIANGLPNQASPQLRK